MPEEDQKIRIFNHIQGILKSLGIELKDPLSLLSRNQNRSASTQGSSVKEGPLDEMKLTNTQENCRLFEVPYQQ